MISARGAQAAWVAALLAGLLAGCGGPSAHERVFARAPQRMNGRSYMADMASCWRAVNRAVLGLNFGIDEQDQTTHALQASRHFTKGWRTTTVKLRISLEPAEGEQTLVYASAVERTERLFTRSHHRFFLWIVPLPGGGGVEANRVLEREATIEDSRFYDGLFRAVEEQLQVLVAGR